MEHIRRSRKDEVLQEQFFDFLCQETTISYINTLLDASKNGQLQHVCSVLYLLSRSVS